jgi:sugar lactone lactonase YvrE
MIAADTGVITTVAGKGFGDFGVFFSGDGGPATDALIFFPQGLALDSSDNLFIADRGNNRIRRVAADSGVITTVGLFTATGIALGADSYLYIAESFRVFRLALSNGAVTIVAGSGFLGFGGDGGPATSAKLNSPRGIAVDARGDIYFSDTGASRIRKVAVDTGLISTFAGGGATFPGDGQLATDARLGSPLGIAFDPAGNLFVADNGRVRKIDGRTRIMTTIAGTGVGGSSGDGGPAASATLEPSDLAVDASGNLYVAEALQNRIRKISSSTGIITTVAGNGLGVAGGDGGAATNTGVFAPGAIAIDRSGNLHIAEPGRVRRVSSATGIIATIAGNGSSGSSGDGGPATSASVSPAALAFDAGGDLFVAGAGRIRKISSATGVITAVAGNGATGFSGDGGPATSASLGASGIAFDAGGNLFVADSSNARIRKIYPSSTSPSSGVSYEGLWLKGDESGWGINVTHQGSTLFATWFTYDSDGSGMWLSMSEGVRTSATTYSGALYQTVGPPFNAVPFASIAYPENYTVVGTLTFSFADANNGTMSYTVKGVTQSKPISRYIFAAGGGTCVLGGAHAATPNYQDLWLNSPPGTESGWGLNITHQGDILFATWFTYLPGPTQRSNGMWLVMSNGDRMGPGMYAGLLQATTGPPFSAVPFDPARVTRTTVGSATVQFTGLNEGIFSYTVNGVTGSKRISRYVFATPTTVCH